MKRHLLVISFFLLFVLAGLNCRGSKASLTSGDPDLRREAISRLATSSKATEYTQQFIELLEKDPDYLVRAQAAAALGDLKVSSTVPHLIKALDDPDQWVRLDVAKALGKIGDRQAVPPLLKLLADDRYAGVRRAAARGLGNIKDPTAIKGLIASLEDIDPGVSEISYQSLCRITGKDLPKDINAWQEWYDKQTK